jgi:tetratricopeptide (TPR) repeat protein
MSTCLETYVSLSSEALTTYDQVLRMGLGVISNRNWQVWYQKYEIFRQLGRKKEAKDAYQKSIEDRSADR